MVGRFRNSTTLHSSPDELRGLWSGLREPFERGRCDVTRRGAARLRRQLIHLLVQVGRQPAAGQHRNGRLHPVLYVRLDPRQEQTLFKLKYVFFCINFLRKKFLRENVGNYFRKLYKTCCSFIVLDRVSDPDPFCIQIQSGQWIRIRIRNPDPDPGGQKWPTKVEKI